MKTYLVQKRPAVFSWDQIPEIEMEYMPWTSAAEISAAAQVCYDETNLYVRLRAKESQIRAEFTGILDMPCLDSCLEFFLAPEYEDPRYLNVEYNPNACMYLGIVGAQREHVRLLPDDREQFCPCAARTEDGWEICFRIPAGFIRQFFPDFTMKSGRKMRANFYKCGELTAQRHYLAWNPVTSEQPDFHRPCDFGELELE